MGTVQGWVDGCIFILNNFFLNVMFPTDHQLSYFSWAFAPWLMYWEISWHGKLKNISMHAPKQWPYLIVFVCDWNKDKNMLRIILSCFHLYWSVSHSWYKNDFLSQLPCKEDKHDIFHSPHLSGNCCVFVV